MCQSKESTYREPRRRIARAGNSSSIRRHIEEAWQGRTEPSALHADACAFATTTIGAVVYLPIILCIFLINIAVGFSGTYVVTGLMMLGTLYLLCWDYDRWKSVLPGFGASAHRDATRHLGTRATLIAGFMAGLLGLGAASLTTSLVDHTSLARPLALLAVATALCTAAVERYRRTVRAGPASDQEVGECGGASAM